MKSLQVKRAVAGNNILVMMRSTVDLSILQMKEVKLSKTDLKIKKVFLVTFSENFLWIFTRK